MPASTYLGNALLESVLRGTAFPVPSRVYVSLHTADPGVSGANEVTTGMWPAYARQDPAQGAAMNTGFPAPSAKSTSNAKQMLYGAMNGVANVTISHFGIWDAASGGNMLVYGTLQDAKTLAPTDECVINTTKLSATVT
jgi:hypothetical protein